MTTRSPLDPAPGVPRADRAARAFVPGGPATVCPPPRAAVAGGKTSRRGRAGREPTAETPGPSGSRGTLPAGRDTGKPRPGRASTDSSNARPGQGQKALAGEEWRKAAKAALRGTPTRRATSKPTAPPASLPAGGTALTSTAHCIYGCGWTAGPGGYTDIDKAADKHTTRPPKHPTATVAELAGTQGAA